METEMKVVKEKEIVHEDDDRDYAKKGVANAGLALGIIGTAFGAAALWGRRGGLGGGVGSPENVNINAITDNFGSRSGAPTAFQAWEKSCQEAIALTNTIWGLQVNTQNEMYAHRETDVAEKFGLWKSQVDADFGLYKSQRDLYDVLNERYANKFNELDKQIAVLAATRPYQDRLLQCEIDRAFTASVNYTDRKTCRAIYGVVGLPSTPTVTVLEGANPYGCNCPSQQASAPTA